MNFEPFIDFESVSEEMAEDAHAMLSRYRKAVDAFVAGSPNDVAACAEVLESAHEMDKVFRASYNHLYTMPVMVHVAGEKRVEQNPDDSSQEAIFQRCARCGSVLSFFHEEMGILDPETGTARRMEEGDIPWWEEGTIVAKSNSEHGIGMYEIAADQELEKHERMCVALNDLVGDES